jgi:hypothetical protein
MRRGLIHGGTTYWLINIPNDRAANNKKRRPLESSQDSKYEKRSQVRRQGCSYTEASEERSACN